MIANLNQLENICEVVEMIQEHVFDECYECETDCDRIELIVELAEEFFNIKVDENVSRDLLELAEKELTLC